MQRIPIGPTGAAMEKPMARPRRKKLIPGQKAKDRRQKGRIPVFGAEKNFLPSLV
jgi:hypothetical protein